MGDLDALDPEAGDGDVCEHDFCPTLNGLGPHNYQPVLDPFAGTGLWMYCNQCGDTFNVDGTATTPQGAAPATAPAPATSPGPFSSKPTGPTPFP